ALAIYPRTKSVTVSPGQDDGGFAFAIRNQLRNEATAGTFAYEVKLADGTNCGITAEQFPSWVLLGRQESGIALTTGGDDYVNRVIFNIPSNAPLCTFRVRVEATHSTQGLIAQDQVDVRIA